MLHNYQDEHLLFLKAKIKDIKIALFKSENNSELQLPNNIIQTIKVDDDGTVWFFTSCHGNQSAIINKSFFANLDYYKKGTDFRLNLSGKGTIIENNDEELISLSNYSKGTFSRLVLVKVKIMQAEFFEKKTISKMTWTNRIKSAIDHFFLTPREQVYNFS